MYDPFSLVKQDVAQHWADFVNFIEQEVHLMMQKLIDWILVTPYVGSDVITMKAWHIVQAISLTLLGLIFAYEGFKQVALFERGIGHAIELKQLLARTIYGVLLSIFSLNIVNIFIGLNNSLVGTLAVNFPLRQAFTNPMQTTEAGLITVVLLIVQLVIGLRLIIHYWIRQAKIYLLAVMAPMIYILGIRQTTNRVGVWITDLATTIFSQAVHALILVLYSMLVTSAAAKGGFEGIILSVAMLILMVEAPPMLRQYIGTQGTNPINTARNLGRSVGKIQRVWKSFVK